MPHPRQPRPDGEIDRIAGYLRQHAIPFSELRQSDLKLDAVYMGGEAPNLKAEPLSKLLPIGNQGGFRYITRGSPKRVVLCALISSTSEPDWPDSLDIERGIFTYYGDNRAAGGGDMHNTKIGGNRILRDSFNALHLQQRNQIPVFLVFTKQGLKRNYMFRGLAVPGANGLGANEDLVALWKNDPAGRRFQNYRARFSILAEESISRKWIEEIDSTASTTGEHAPQSWRDFVQTGRIKTLQSVPTLRVRSRQEQLPASDLERDVLNTIVDHYKAHPRGEYAFELCAVELCKLADPRIVNLELTPPMRDGGRDAIGYYRLGTEFSYIKVEFAMEAKCYPASTGNGVKMTSRLISRLRHRQFGYFVTTSYVSDQAYQELVDDNHPIVIFSGRDISRILIDHGMNSSSSVRDWLGRIESSKA